jgi:hypothetical protein
MQAKEVSAGSIFPITPSPVVGAVYVELLLSTDRRGTRSHEGSEVEQWAEVLAYFGSGVCGATSAGPRWLDGLMLRLHDTDARKRHDRVMPMPGGGTTMHGVEAVALVEPLLPGAGGWDGVGWLVQWWWVGCLLYT